MVGGYDPSLAPEAYAMPARGVDVVVRGEGEHHVSRTAPRDGGVPRLRDIPGLSWRRDGRDGRQTAIAPVASLEDGDISLPNRRARVLDGYTLLGRQVDVIETSRGCTYDCSFCSIIEMRGRNFHRSRLPRDRRHHRCARSRRADHLPRRRQHHARRAPVRGTVPGDHRRRTARPRLHRAGHDVGDRGSRRRRWRR